MRRYACSKLVTTKSHLSELCLACLASSPSSIAFLVHLRLLATPARSVIANVQLWILWRASSCDCLELALSLVEWCCQCSPSVRKSSRPATAASS